MKLRHFIYSTLLITTSLYSQNTRHNWDYDDSTDSIGKMKKINYINTQRVDDLLAKKRRIDSKNNKVNVFRIQLFSGSRSGSVQALNNFKKLFPSTSIETSYEQPYFKTKVAAFRTRLEAEKALIKYKKHFKSAFIYEEKIPLDKL